MLKMKVLLILADHPCIQIMAVIKKEEILVINLHQIFLVVLKIFLIAQVDSLLVIEEMNPKVKKEMRRKLLD